MCIYEYNSAEFVCFEFHLTCDELCLVYSYENRHGNSQTVKHTQMTFVICKRQKVHVEHIIFVTSSLHLPPLPALPHVHSLLAHIAKTYIRLFVSVSVCVANNNWRHLMTIAHRWRNLKATELQSLGTTAFGHCAIFTY